MRFISPEGLRIIAVHDDWEVMGTGLPHTKSTGYTVEFSQWDSTDRERELARKTFTWKNRKKDEGGNDLDPLDDEHRIWSFDSNMIQDAELRKQVEKILLEKIDQGAGFMLVEREDLAPPYAKYDEHRKLQGRRTLDHAINDITAAYEQVGFDIDQAVAYEQENGNMGEVVAALIALRKVEEPEETLVSA